MRFSEAAFFVLFCVEYEVVVASYDNIIAFKVCEVRKEIKEESLVIFIWSINVSQG